MRYKSTRGGTTQDDYSFEEALFSGYAPDGGLFVPASLPSFREKEQYSLWSHMTFPELVYDVLVSMVAHVMNNHIHVRLINNIAAAIIFQTLLTSLSCYTASLNSGNSFRLQKLMMPI